MSNENKLSIMDKMKAAADKGAAKAEAEQAQAANHGKAQAQEVKNAEKHLYQGNHVKRLVLKSGVIVLPNEVGVFIPKSQEEYDMLEHMAASSTCSLEKLTGKEVLPNKEADADK